MAFVFSGISKGRFNGFAVVIEDNLDMTWLHKQVTPRRKRGIDIVKFSMASIRTDDHALTQTTLSPAPGRLWQRLSFKKRARVPQAREAD